ncbi:acyloxyacyl hydrolase [Aromatoleum diolicum]|uniref:Lipid A deacylase n=1 Tax=Aromatoleum diolicum TaxID=75796 RepID=A0ABX1QI35_9RHOO|nr:outer membrane beta-barrel protein [Aromatoleum diolicum]
MKSCVLLTAAALAAGAASAADVAVTVFHGEHDNYDRSGASVRLGPVWERDWGAWHAGLHPEFELSRFRYNGSSHRADTLDQGGVVGMLRLVRGQGSVQPYAELGFGGALFTRTSLGPKEFSTAFQFSQHAGLGVEFARRFSAGWRYSHYSNGDIKNPNDGFDLHQLVLGARF